MAWFAALHIGAALGKVGLPAYVANLLALAFSAALVLS